MKVAVVVFVIGDVYQQNFNQYFRKNLEMYCKKYNYDFILLDKLIKHEENMDKRKFFWQRLLLPDKFRSYDYVVSIDSDIYVNMDSPGLPLDEIPEGKVAAVNERKYFGNFEWREMIQTQMGWEKTGKDWYALSNEKKNYNDHINGGLVIYQPKYHGDKLKQLYDNNIKNYTKYHQDDQSILSSYLIDNDMIYWLDERYNRIWFFWKHIFYPDFDTYPTKMKQSIVKNFTKLNYFTHFTGQADREYI